MKAYLTCIKENTSYYDGNSGYSTAGYTDYKIGSDGLPSGIEYIYPRIIEANNKDEAILIRNKDRLGKVAIVAIRHGDGHTVFTHKSGKYYSSLFMKYDYDKKRNEPMTKEQKMKNKREQQKKEREYRLGLAFDSLVGDMERPPDWMVDHIIID